MDVTKVICTSNGGQLRLIFQQPFWNTWGVNIFVWVCVEWIKKLRAKCSTINRSDICITKYYHCLNRYVLAISSLKLKICSLLFLSPYNTHSCTLFCTLNVHSVSLSYLHNQSFHFFFKCKYLRLSREIKKKSVIKVNFKQVRDIGTYCTA